MNSRMVHDEGEEVGGACFRSFEAASPLVTAGDAVMGAGTLPGELEVEGLGAEEFKLGT